MDGWRLDGWVDGWMEVGWMDGGWMDGWMNGQAVAVLCLFYLSRWPPSSGSGLEPLSSTPLFTLLAPLNSTSTLLGPSPYLALLNSLSLPRSLTVADPTPGLRTEQKSQLPLKPKPVVSHQAPLNTHIHKHKPFWIIVFGKSRNLLKHDSLVCMRQYETSRFGNWEVQWWLEVWGQGLGVRGQRYQGEALPYTDHPWENAIRALET